MNKLELPQTVGIALILVKNQITGKYLAVN
jgi:hypothetical protein